MAISADTNLATAAARAAGIPVVMGDPSDPAVLRAARVDRAARVVAAWNEDAVNVGAAAAAGRLARPAGLPPLRLAVRLMDGELAHLLRATELGADGHVRLEFFNVHDRAAHALLNEHPLSPAGERPHLVVAGLGQFGSGLVLAAAQQWATRGEGPLRVTLIDREAQGRLNALRMRHPALTPAIDATCVALDFRAPSDEALAGFARILTELPPTLVVVAFENEALAWTAGMFIRRRVTRPVDVVVRTESEGGFGEQLSATVGSRGGWGRIVVFPYLDRACTPDLVEGGVREQLARALHADHVARAGSGAALHRDWSQLRDAERESSRAAADAIVTRLEAIGARLVPMAGWDTERDVFTEAQVDHLAALEHARWKAEREAAGWTYGEVRDDAAKRNPLLVDWADLPDEAKRYNLDAARALPALLARAGFEIA